MDESFSIGDNAYYPVHGVAQVVGLVEIAGSDSYVLKIVESGLKITVPAKNAEAVGLRALVSDDEIDEVYSILQSKDAGTDHQTWNRRHREYMEKIKTGSAFEIAEVVRDLCLLRASKSLSFGERRMLETARGLLVKEIALAKETTENAVVEEIEGFFDHAA